MNTMTMTYDEYEAYCAESFQHAQACVEQRNIGGAIDILNQIQEQFINLDPNNVTVNQINAAFVWAEKAHDLATEMIEHLNGAIHDMIFNVQ